MKIDRQTYKDIGIYLYISNINQFKRKYSFALNCQLLVWEVSSLPTAFSLVSVSPLVAPRGDNVPPPSVWPWPLTAGGRQACRSRTADNHPRSRAGETCSLAHSIWIHILPSGTPGPGSQRKEHANTQLSSSNIQLQI